MEDKGQGGGQLSSCTTTVNTATESSLILLEAEIHQSLTVILWKFEIFRGLQSSKMATLEDPTQLVQFKFYCEDLKSMLQRMVVHHAGLYLDGKQTLQ